MYEVQFVAEGFFDPSAKTDSRFTGTLEECKNFLKDEEKKLSGSGFYGEYSDDFTMEVKRKTDNEATLEKYIIAKIL